MKRISTFIATALCTLGMSAQTATFDFTDDTFQENHPISKHVLNVTDEPVTLHASDCYLEYGGGLNFSGFYDSKYPSECTVSVPDGYLITSIDYVLSTGGAGDVYGFTKYSYDGEVFAENNFDGTDGMVFDKTKYIETFTSAKGVTSKTITGNDTESLALVSKIIVTYKSITPTAINTVSTATVAPRKYMENGQIVICKDGVKYNIAGQRK